MLEEKLPYPGQCTDGQAGALPSWVSYWSSFSMRQAIPERTKGAYKNTLYGVELEHSGANERRNWGRGLWSFLEMRAGVAASTVPASSYGHGDPGWADPQG